MIVDHRYRYVFVAVPKTASISLQFTLGWGSAIPEPHLYHQSIADVLETYPDCVDYFKFAMVRNPWARLVSLYHDFTKLRVKQYSALVCHDKPLLSEFKDFEDLCLRLKDSPWKEDVFFRSQFKQLSIDGRLGVDFVGRYESIEESFAEICARIGHPGLELEKRNLGVYDRASYRSYYSEAAMKAIRDFYLDDVEHFGYDY